MRLMKKKEQKNREKKSRKNVFWTMPRKDRKFSQKFTNFFSDMQGTSSETTQLVPNSSLQLESLEIMENTSTPQKSSQVNGMKQLNIMAFESDEESETMTEDEIAFSSLHKLLHLENAIHLAIFINFTIVHSHAEQILFYLITNLYRQGNIRDMRKWAYEIYSSFIATDAPLQIFNPEIQKKIALDIDMKLTKMESFKADYEVVTSLHEIFKESRFETLKIINEQLDYFQNKRKAGLESLYGLSPVKDLQSIHKDREKEQKIIEKNLMPKLLMMMEDLEECDEKNPKLNLLVSALSTVINQIFRTNTAFIEPVDQFVCKLMRPCETLNVKGHQLVPRTCQSTTFCDYCLNVMFGIAPQGFECECGIKVHESCIKSLKGTCILYMENLSINESTQNESRDSSKLYELVHSALGNRRVDNYRRSKSNRPKSDPGLYVKQLSDSSSDDNSYGGSHWTNTVALEFQSLSENAKKRRDIIIEIFETERRHVKLLKLLHNIFHEPLKRSKAMSIELSSMLFPPSFFVIKDWHFSFEAMLKKAWHEQQGVLLEVGCCLSIFDGTYGDILKENAANFCAGQRVALENLREQRSKNEILQRALIKAEGHKRCKRLQLKDLLITIFQRLTKYPLLFERLLKYSEGSESEKVQKALESSKKILHYVNTAVRNAEELRGVHRKLSFDKDAPNEFKSINLLSHKLIHDGFLTAKKGAIPLRVLLFEKILVLLHKFDDKYLLRSCDNMKVPIIKLHHAIVRSNAANTRSFYLIIQNEQISQMLELISSGEVECKSWIEKLHEAIENANQVNQRKSLNESAQLILRSDSKNQLDMSKSVDLAAIGSAIIAQTKQLEECFQDSHKSLRNQSESSSNDDVESLSVSINTLSRLVSQLTMKIAERDHERELYLRENQRLRDNLQQ